MNESLKEKFNKILQKESISKVTRIFSRILKRNVIDIIKEDVKNNYIKILVENTKYDYKAIKILLNKIDNIQKNVHCAHGEFELYTMQAMLLSLSIDGPIIELGCYKGGSTAKLSLICKLTGRTLYAFDSFEGLPSPSEKDLSHEYMSFVLPKKSVSYNVGSYTGSLEEVKKNVMKYGNIDVCKFVKGYFEDTLPNFEVNPACIFMDVDYIESAQTVIKYLWPKLLPNGFLFSHEGLVIDYIKAITDPNWWEKELYQKPPLLYGAGYGSCWRLKNFAFSSNIVYFKKEN